jgi:hypothetical protein
MNLKRIVITNLFGLLFVINSNANNRLPSFCGWDPAWEDVYYPIINQYDLVDEPYWAFLNCPNVVFCEFIPDSAYDSNIEEWHNYFKGSFSQDEILQLIYKKTVAWIQGEETINTREKLLFQKINQKKYAYFKRYLLLAKSTEHLSSDKGYAEGWYQGEVHSSNDKSYWIEKAFLLMKDAPNQFFKNRVGFQIVKLAHYKQDNALAIEVFNKYLKLKNNSKYIYYRALEQVSGAYFNIGKHTIAAKNYINIFDKLPDRRESCALSLRYIDWSQFTETKRQFKSPVHKIIFSFFKAYYGRGDLLKEMENIANVNPNSPYLKVLIARQIDELQANIFQHGYNSYYFDNNKTINKEVVNSILKTTNTILLNEDLQDKSALLLLKAIAKISIGKYNEAKVILNAPGKWLTNKAHKKRLHFAIDVMAIKTPNSNQINSIFNKIDKDKELNSYKPTVAVFFNHISALYSQENPILSAFIATDYDSYTPNKTFNWNTINKSYAYNYSLETKYPFLDINVINSFDKFLKLPIHNAFEQTILDRIQINAADFVNELRGTYYLGQNELSKALKAYEAIKNPSEFWEEEVRPEIFSGSIKEWMNVDFESISDKIHLDYTEELGLNQVPNLKEDPQLFRENYNDNKIKLIKILMKLKTLAKKNKDNAAEYYYMLGNAWYNMSASGWFVNNLYYISNDSRNNLWDTYSENNIEAPDHAMLWAEQYFNEGLSSKGDNEVKAKLTFMLAKTISCFDLSWNNTNNTYDFDLCENHKDYFKNLRENYSKTNYYKEVLKECSWLRWYNNNY